MLLVAHPGIATQTREARSTLPRKSTPIVRSVRKAVGLEAETARLPRKRRWSAAAHFRMPTEAYQ
jgi:hypothetical protein